MFWLLTAGTFAIWLLAALANVGGDFVDLLLVVPAAALVFQIWPKPRPADQQSSTAADESSSFSSSLTHPARPKLSS